MYVKNLQEFSKQCPCPEHPAIHPDPQFLQISGSSDTLSDLNLQCAILCLTNLSDDSSVRTHDSVLCHPNFTLLAHDLRRWAGNGTSFMLWNFTFVIVGFDDAPPASSNGRRVDCDLSGACTKNLQTLSLWFLWLARCQSSAELPKASHLP